MSVSVPAHRIKGGLITAQVPVVSLSDESTNKQKNIKSMHLIHLLDTLFIPKFRSVQLNLKNVYFYCLL